MEAIVCEILCGMTSALSENSSGLALSRVSIWVKVSEVWRPRSSRTLVRYSAKNEEWYSRSGVLFEQLQVIALGLVGNSDKYLSQTVHNFKHATVSTNLDSYNVLVCPRTTEQQSMTIMSSKADQRCNIQAKALFLENLLTQQLISVFKKWTLVKINSSDISRVPDQNGVSQARYIVEIHHSGWEPSIYWLLQ